MLERNWQDMNDVGDVICVEKDACVDLKAYVVYDWI